MRWSREDVYIGTSEYFDALILECERAAHSIHMEFYIFEDDDVGQRIIECLLRAHERGVHVRLLVDGFGSAKWIVNKAKHYADLGIAIRVFHPLPLYSFPGGMCKNLFILPRILPYFLHVNQRNHRKTCLIDGKVAWVGSHNAFDGKLTTRDKIPWRETGARVEGDDVMQFESAFLRAWRRSWSVRKNTIPTPRAFQPHREQHHYVGLAHLNDSTRRRIENRRDLLRRISAAQQRVWITNAYFVPARSLVQALRKTGRKGVDVRILVPSRSDVTFMPWVSAAFYYALLKAGVRIFEYQPTILHAKSCLIDDRGLVGSSNLNYRSLLHDLEADVVLNHPTSVATLENAFLKDLENSREVSMQDWYDKSRITKFFGRTALVFKWWM